MDSMQNIYQKIYEKVLVNNYYPNGTVSYGAKKWKPTGYYADFSINKTQNKRIFLYLAQAIYDKNPSKIKTIFEMYFSKSVQNDIEKRYNNDYNRILEVLDGTFKEFIGELLKEKASIYRVIKATSAKDIDKERLGNHWVISPNNLDTCAQWCEDYDGDFYIIEARCKWEDINWKRSFWTTFYDGEAIGEVNTIPSFKSTYVKIEKFDFSEYI